MPKNTPMHNVFKLHKSKDKEKTLQKQEKNYLPLDEKDNNYICLLKSPVSKKVENNI